MVSYPYATLAELLAQGAYISQNPTNPAFIHAIIKKDEITTRYLFNPKMEVFDFIDSYPSKPTRARCRFQSPEESDREKQALGTRERTAEQIEGQTAEQIEELVFVK